VDYKNKLMHGTLSDFGYRYYIKFAPAGTIRRTTYVLIIVIEILEILTCWKLSVTCPSFINSLMEDATHWPLVTLFIFYLLV